MVKNTKHYLLGYASGLAGADTHAGDGPKIIKQSRYLSELNNLDFAWLPFVVPDVSVSDIVTVVKNSCTLVAEQTSKLIKNNQTFTVLGGDHTAAIGTWSGVHDAVHDKGELGLIWIDAHMDSHTPESSESGRVHGMPLACLLGKGNPELTKILNPNPKIKPENVCLIGVRSFESGEAALLKSLNVKIYFMEEVFERGFVTILKEAVKHVSANTVGYGITLDLDAIDPSEAPGVDVPEPNGISVNELMLGLSAIVADPRLIATEIVEFDPSRDKNEITEKLIIQILKLILQRE